MRHFAVPLFVTRASSFLPGANIAVLSSSLLVTSARFANDLHHSDR
jgi:hypothetical protein